tara:strand:+ start:181 stop:321 length:141 start_codon:yes stop_codon:yes gene_type:complete
MKEKTKAILIAVLMVLAIGSAIVLIDSPKPNKLATTITREIKEIMK